MGKLDGRTAIITGAARGQGEAEARLFVAEGANVIVADVLDDAGEAVAASLGDAAVFTRLDVRDAASWERAVTLAQERFGGLDVLVNNAGILRRGTVEGATMDEYDAIVAVNQTGVFLGLRAVAPAMRAAGGGAIVNISSAAGFTGTPGLAAYAMTKWAVRGLTKTAALELADAGIRVNSVHPGIIATDMLLDVGMPDRGVEAGRTANPLGRAGTPEDVAAVVLFLASNDSRFVTGTELIVDGGSLAGRRPAPE
jgi:3alpha(or 20beta)-hydroxysteroid dehydrogenase